jgi:hypothetical protein
MDTVPTVFTQSLAMLQKVGDCAICMQVGSLVYDARNKLAEQAIKIGADLVFWLDSDMVFEPSTLVDMVKTLTDNDLDFLTGIYYRRREPFTPVIFNKTEYDGTKCETSEFDEIPEGLFEVGSCGFGCVLLKTEILLDVLAKFGNINLLFSLFIGFKFFKEKGSLSSSSEVTDISLSPSAFLSILLIYSSIISFLLKIF